MIEYFIHNVTELFISQSLLTTKFINFMNSKKVSFP